MKLGGVLIVLVVAVVVVVGLGLWRVDRVQIQVWRQGKNVCASLFLYFTDFVLSPLFSYVNWVLLYVVLAFCNTSVLKLKLPTLSVKDAQNFQWVLKPHFAYYDF